MDLGQYQEILAKAAINNGFREKFFSGKADSPAESMLGLDPNDLSFFANSLLHKRLHAVQGLLPLTSKMVGGDFPRLFMEYADAYLPTGIHKHHDDAWHFAKYLRRKLYSLGLPHYAASIIKQEANRVKNFYRPHWLSIKICFYEVAEITNPSLALPQPFLKSNTRIMLYSKGKLILNLDLG